MSAGIGIGGRTAVAATPPERPEFALTWLYAPGDRPAVVAKPLRSGADVVLVDLEDAVRADRKAPHGGRGAPGKLPGCPISLTPPWA